MFLFDLEVKINLLELECKQKMMVNQNEQHLIDFQLEHFKMQNKLFSNPLAIREIGKKTLAAW